MSITVNHGDMAALPANCKEMPVTIVLDRLRSAHNTGNIFRLADAVRAQKIITCGYTPSRGHQKLAKTAMGTEELIDCETAETSYDAVKLLKEQGYHIYAVETVKDALPYSQLEFEFPAALVFGNEALGIEPQTLEICDHFVCLPAEGYKNSINVGNCAAVVLFECHRQWKQ